MLINIFPFVTGKLKILLHTHFKYSHIDFYRAEGNLIFSICLFGGI